MAWRISSIVRSVPGATRLGAARRIYVVAFVCASLAAAAFGVVRAATPSRPPNVILIVMDTTRADRCSVMGAAAHTTPALEKLASRGAAYTQCWSPAGWTAPAHASLFTGVLPRRTGVMLGSSMVLSETLTPLAQVLRDAGWATGAFSNNEMVGPSTGLARGFDHFVPMYEWQAPQGVTRADATHDLAAAWALSQFHEEKPFFLFINDLEPHLPYLPPRDLERQFLPSDATDAEIEAGRAFDFPRTLDVLAGTLKLSEREYQILTGLYDAEIAGLDRAIGTLVDRLEAAGALENTVIIVTGDHGENLGEHGLVEHRFSLHRTILHVPLVVRIPGELDDGRIVKDVVRLEDLMPTVLDHCGLPAPQVFDGSSLLSAPRERVAEAVYGRPWSYVESALRANPPIDLRRYNVKTRAVFDGRLHLISRSDGEDQLYDVGQDPGETRDLAKERPEDVARLKSLLQ